MRRWIAAILLSLTTSLAPADGQPAARVDQYGDPLPDGAVARLGTVRWRARLAQCLAFSRDGKLLATGNSDGTARLWEAATGREVVRFHRRELGEVREIALSPDGSTLATLDSDQKVHLWDARTGKHRYQVLRDFMSVICWAKFVFTFSPDSQTLYVGRGDSCRAIAVASGRIAAMPAAPERGLLVDAVSPDGRLAVSPDNGGRLVVWDLRTGKSMAKVAVPAARGLFALSTDGTRLAVATAENEPVVVVYDVATGKERCRCKGHQAAVTFLSFSADNQTLATGACDLTARLWDARSGKQRWSYSGLGVTFYWVRGAVAPDGKTVAVAGWDGIVRMLEVVTGKERVPIAGHLGWVDCLAVTPDGSAAFTAGEDGSLRQWEVATGKEVRTLVGPRRDRFVAQLNGPREQFLGQRVVHAENAWIKRLDMTPDGKKLLVAKDFHAWLWDLSDPDQPHVGKRIECSASALSPDGKVLATLLLKLCLWDIRTQKLLRAVQGTSEMAQLRLSPDLSTLALSRSGVIRLYNVPSLKEKRVLGGQGVWTVQAMVFSPDGHILAANAGDSCVELWEVASGQLRRRIDRKQSTRDALAFSPDGRWLAMGGTDNNVTLHDVATNRTVRIFRGHDDWITCLAFTPDGRRLISGSRDTTALVWDVSAVAAAAAPEVQRTAAEMAGLWAELAGDAARADAAMRALAASPAQTAKLLGRLLTPVEKGRAARIARLIGALDNDAFAERERGLRELEEIGEEAAVALHAALENPPSAELRRRVEDLLARLKTRGSSPEHLRGLRAVQVLAWIGTAEARGVLRAVASGAPKAERTRAAAAALGRQKPR